MRSECIAALVLIIKPIGFQRRHELDMLVDGQRVREQQHILMHEGDPVPDGYRLCKSPGRPNLEKISMWNQLRQR